MGAEGQPPEPGAPFLAGRVATLAGAHFVHDVYTALLPALLPLLIPRLSLSLALAGVLVFCLNAPSIANPLLGAWVDRARLARPLVVLAPSATALGMVLTGLAPSAWALAALLLVTGISVAAIHVAAPVLVAEAAGSRLGRGTSFFMVGGELARTAGPLVAVAAVAAFGLEGLPWLLPLGLATSLLLWWRTGERPSEARAPREAVAPAGLLETARRMRRLMIGVSGVLVARAFMVAALGSYLPVYMHGEGSSLLLSSSALSVFELAGAAGALLAGTVSDRLGRRSVLLVAVLAAPPLMLLFLGVRGGLALPVLLALGFATLSTTPVLLAAVIEGAGPSRATAVGLFMMTSFAIRSLVVPLVGGLGDALGLGVAFGTCAAFAAVGVPFVFLIPGRPKAQ